MTARDFIAKLAPEELDRLSGMFRHLAEHITEARLSTGLRLIDLTDVRAYFYELASAADFFDSPQGRAMRHSVDSTCPRCGHVHQGSAECGQEIGGGRICRCELEVRA